MPSTTQVPALGVDAVRINSMLGDIPEGNGADGDGEADAEGEDDGFDDDYDGSSWWSEGSDEMATYWYKQQMARNGGNVNIAGSDRSSGSGSDNGSDSGSGSGSGEEGSQGEGGENDSDRSEHESGQEFGAGEEEDRNSDISFTDSELNAIARA